MSNKLQIVKSLKPFEKYKVLINGIEKEFTGQRLKAFIILNDINEITFSQEKEQKKDKKNIDNN